MMIIVILILLIGVILIRKKNVKGITKVENIENPMEVLEKRLQKNEITKSEYDELKKTLEK